MGKNNNSGPKRLKPAWQVLEESDKRIEQWNATRTVWVQGTHTVYKTEDILRLIKAANGKLLEIIPFKNSDRLQYKIEIKGLDLDDMMFESGPVLTFSRYCPFNTPVNRGRNAFLSSKDCL